MYINKTNTVQVTQQINDFSEGKTVLLMAAEQNFPNISSYGKGYLEFFNKTIVVGLFE